MSRRIARTWAGGVLLLGALVLFLRVTLGAAPDHEHGMSAAAIILGTWFASFVTYRIARSFRPHERPPETLARTALIVPTLGVLALLPLTIHLPFFAITGNLGDFGGWAALSVVFTAPTTIVAGVMMSVRASDLVTYGSVSSRVFRPWWIYLISIASCGPLILFVLPPILIALTGLPFVALMAYQARLAAKERAILELGEIPAALAKFRAVA